MILKIKEIILYSIFKISLRRLNHKGDIENSAKPKTSLPAATKANHKNKQQSGLFAIIKMLKLTDQKKK